MGMGRAHICGRRAERARRIQHKGRPYVSTATCQILFYSQ